METLCSVCHLPLKEEEKTLGVCVRCCTPKPTLTTPETPCQS